MTQQLVGRLALRVEGDLWCAYYAREDTMDKAIFLGSIRMKAIVGNLERKEAFMEIMRSAVADFLEEILGESPVWGDPQKAPEHERGGNA